MFSLVIAESQELSEEHCAVLKECLASAKAVAQSVSQEHKDVHGPISKYGRSIDKVGGSGRHL